MISETIYRDYLGALLAGKLSECKRLVQELIDADIELRHLYSHLYQRSLYEVGERWETNQITVANEHLATSITEHLLGLSYPIVFGTERIGKSAVICCIANEFHQIGGKMVADILELNGWDGHFLGANTSIEDVLQTIQQEQPDLVGLSLSILSNLGSLKRAIEAIKADFPNTEMILGGQAFRWGGTDISRRYPGTEYISSLDELEKLIARH